MRRRVTYAFGGHFIAPHKSMLFLSYLEVPGGPLWSSLGVIRPRFDVLASLFDAQAAQIRVGVLFYILCKDRHIIFYAQAAYIRAIGGSRALRRPLVDAQAAQIRVGVIFDFFVFKQTHQLLCAGCGDQRLASFWSLPGALQLAPGVVVVVCFMQRLRRPASTNT